MTHERCSKEMAAVGGDAGCRASDEASAGFEFICGFLAFG
jgi:hypothetical protein